MARQPLSSFEREVRRIVANNLKKITYGYTRAQVSEKTGIPTSTLSGYFIEKSTISAKNAEIIAKSFNVNVSDIDPRLDEEWLKENQDKHYDWKDLDEQLTDKHFASIKRAENAPDWATDEDVIELEDMLKSNQPMHYGGIELSKEDKERIDAVLEQVFWERLKEKRESNK